MLMLMLADAAYTSLRGVFAWPHVTVDSLLHMQVYTAGGGAKNAKWMAMRAVKLGVPVEASPHAEAAYGAALLARQGWRQRAAQQG